MDGEKRIPTGRISVERVFQLKADGYSNIKIAVSGDDAKEIIKEIYKIYYYERALAALIQGNQALDLDAIYAKLDDYLAKLNS